MSKLVVVDIGSFNIKINNGSVHENRFKKVSNMDTFGHEFIMYDGDIYFFGEGQFDRTYDKTQKNIIVPLLYGLGKEGVAGNINLILHLPLNQMSKKSDIVNQLEGKTFEFVINGQGNSITFDKVGVLKEGFSSFYSLAKRNDGLIAIIDIGGRTTDVFTFDNGKPEHESSKPYGTMNYFSDIANSLVGQGELRVLEDIHKLIVNDIIDLKDFENERNDLFNNLLNDLRMEFSNLKDYNIKLCGGGAEYFIGNFKSVFPKVELLKNTLLSNVDGATFIGKAKGLDK